MQAGTRFTYPGGTEGSVDLAELIAPRPGVEPATFRSRVRRRTAAPPRIIKQLPLCNHENMNRKVVRTDERDCKTIKMLNAITITVSKMTSHCAGTVQIREESESGIRKWEEMWFKPTAEDGERRGSSDVRWKTVPQTSGCNRKRSVADSGQTSTLNVQRRWWGRT